MDGGDAEGEVRVLHPVLLRDDLRPAQAAVGVAIEKAGHEVGGRQTPMGRLVAVAETDAEAEAIARRGAKWTVGAYLPKEAIALFRGDRRQVDPVDHYLNDVVIHGCPERVVDTLQRLEEEVPLKYLLLSPLSAKTFGLFTDRVLPHLVP